MGESSAATIGGRVTDSEGAAVSGAQIVFRNADYSTTVVTAEDGSYSVFNLPAGTYTILIHKPGYADLERESISVLEEGAPQALEFRLQPAAEQMVVRGVEELNPNLFYVKLDTNEILRDLTRRGADAQCLREFRAEENQFGAQYGYPLRTVEWAKPRSGLARFHGSLYEAHQNSSLNARSFFTVGELRSWRRNEYGGAVGGPLASDRLAVDFAVSQVRDTGFVNGNVRVPYLEERRPLAADPTTRTLIAQLLKGFPDELPNLCPPAAPCRDLNTNAIRDIGSTAFSTSLAFRPNGTDQFVAEQRFLDAT
jgi:hypothetical protein